MEPVVGTVIETFLTVTQALLTEIGVSSSSLIDKVLVGLISLVPIVVQNFPNLLAPVQNIIAALKQSGNVTADQMAQLTALDAQVDAAFDAAASADGLSTTPASGT